MIHVDRGDEPGELANERSRKLASVAIGKARELTDYDPKEVRAILHPRQRSCCAYCGRTIEIKGNPIDHFRPKSGADDVNWTAIPAEPSDMGKFWDWFDEHLSTSSPTRRKIQSPTWIRNDDRYWWLTWTWENLVYACVTCNSQTYKGNRFPLKQGTNSLDEHDQPPAHEQPLLFDPSRVDPLDHIRFAPEMPDRWGPVARTTQGRWTIAVLGLHQRPTLRDLWSHCASDISKNAQFVEFFQRLYQLLQHERASQWNALTQELLYQRTEHQALRWCVFDYYIRYHKAQRFNLPLPSPWQVVQRASNPIFIDRPELARFPNNLQMRVRALRPKLDNDGKDELKDVLVQLCGHQALTANELAAMTERKTPSYLESEYLQPLTSGLSPRLAYDAQTKTYRRL